MNGLHSFLHTPHRILDELVAAMPDSVRVPPSLDLPTEPYNASVIVRHNGPATLHDSFTDERTGIVHQAFTAHERLTLQQAYATHLPRLSAWWRDEGGNHIPSLAHPYASLQLAITSKDGACVLLAADFPAPLIAVRGAGRVSLPCLTTLLATLAVLSWQDDNGTPGPLSPDAITTLMMAQGSQWTSVFHADPTFPPAVAPFVERLRAWIPRLTGTPIPYPSAAR